MREFDLVAVFSACSFFLSSQCLLVSSQKGSLVGTEDFLSSLNGICPIEMPFESLSPLVKGIELRF
jgi:hypothetical protein